MFEKFHRGDIYSADLSPGIGSEQSGSRPVLILQNNVGNCFSPTIIIAAITSVSKKSRKFPTTYLKSTDKKQSLRYNILAAGSEVIRVKVEIKMTETAKEPYAVIFTNEMTEAVRQAAAILEGAVSNKAITVTDNERIFVLRPEELYMLRVENERAAVYTRTKRFDSGRRLYEFEDMLGVSFMRISKSVLINLQYLECVEPTLGGLMMVTLKNGCKECISRKYLPAFKKYLGL